MPKKAAKAPQTPPARPRLILRRASIRKAQQEAEEAARAAEDYRRAQERLVRRELDRAKRRAKRAAEAGIIDVEVAGNDIFLDGRPSPASYLFVFYTDDGVIVAVAASEDDAIERIRLRYEADAPLALQGRMTWSAYYVRYIASCNVEFFAAPHAI